MTEQIRAAVIYAAKSSEDKHGSIDGQIADCRALAEREGLEVVGEYRDEAASAFSGDRGDGLGSTLTHAEREGATLIVQHSDRLARGDGRKAKHLVEYALWALKHDVTIRSVQDPQTFGDLLYAVVTGQRNHEDSARKSKATRSGLARRKASGLAVGAIPLGYTVERQVVNGVVVSRRVIDPVTRVVVERIFTLAVAGKTPGDISRTLDAEGAVTKRGKRWRTKAVRKVIENRDYLGENGYPALIDAATWERAQQPKRPVKNRSPRQPADDFVLGGMAVCMDCGASMRSRRCTTTGRRTYRCSNAIEGRKSCTTSRPVPAEDAERELIATVVGYTPDLDDWLAEQAQGHRQEQANAEKALKAVTKALAAVDKRLERLLDDYERLPEAGGRLVLRRAAKVEAERDQAEQRVIDLEAVVAEHQDDPDVDAARDLYRRLLAFAQGRLNEASSPAEVRAALRSLIAEVELGYGWDNKPLVAASLRLVEPEPFTLVYVQVWPERSAPRDSAFPCG